MVRGHLVTQSHNANGNVMGRPHANLILDTRMNQVAFAGSKVTEVIANMFAESMYAQCGAGGSENLI